MDLPYDAYAGEPATPGEFPHELMGAVTVLAIIGLLLIILAAIGIWLLVRIDRRLRRGATEDAEPREGPPSRPPT